jgi:hypothetical protein
MKRIIVPTIIVALLLGLPSFALAGVRTLPLFSATAVASTGTATSSIIDISNARYFSVQGYCVSASGSVDVKIEWITASGNSGDLDLEPTAHSFADIINLTSETWSAVTSFFPPVAPVAWVKLTGQGSNNADTVCSVYLNLGD